MRINRMWALAALGLLLASAAISQVGGNGAKVNGQFTGQRVAGVSINDTSTRVLRVDTSNNGLVVSEGSKDRDLWRLYPNVVNNQLTASGTGMVDSTAIPQDTHDMKQLALVLYGTPDSASTVVRLAVQVRGHYSTSTDSASAFPWIRWPVRSTTVASGVDSIGHTLVGTYSLAQATTANVLASDGGLWPGEFEVKFNMAANDTTGAGNGKYGAYPKGMYIKLVDHGGDYFWAPYTSIRIRVINGVRSRFRIKADLIGRSL